MIRYYPAEHTQEVGWPLNRGNVILTLSHRTLWYRLPALEPPGSLCKPFPIRDSHCVLGNLCLKGSNHIFVEIDLNVFLVSSPRVQHLGETKPRSSLSPALSAEGTWGGRSLSSSSSDDSMSAAARVYSTRQPDPSPHLPLRVCKTSSTLADFRCRFGGMHRR